MSESSPKTTISFTLPPDLTAYLASLDNFIKTTIEPLQNQADNNRFFDHRREHSRTDWDNQGLPRKEWEDLLAECTKLADAAGFFRFSLPREYGGQYGSNLWMAVIRMHLARKGLGLFNDLQNEHSVVGNFPDVLMVREFGNHEQKKELIGGRLRGEVRIVFGLTEPSHGSDATHMDTTAVKVVRDGKEGWLINGTKKWQTGMHRATHVILFARTSGRAGDAKGITAFIVPATTEGVKVESYEWTFNMPTDHATVSYKDVFLPSSTNPILGPEGEGLAIAQTFVHENRLRQAASSLGAAQFCISKAVEYAKERRPFGKPLSSNQGIQFPLVSLYTQAEMLELLILRTATELDAAGPWRTWKDKKGNLEAGLGAKVSMCNFWANRLCCGAADGAMQVHGGNGYGREMPFEHIYRHHRRYRITEGSEEIQMRKVAAYLFGFGGKKKPKDAKL